ncbi:hypothetical protein D9M70_519610 [compost metagenome]
MADPFADCLYDAAEFMTKDLWSMGAGEGMRLFRDEDRPIGIFMQIGPADAAETVLHQHLARPGLRRGLDIVNAEIPGCVKAQSFHLCFLLLFLHRRDSKQHARSPGCLFIQ